MTASPAPLIDRRAERTHLFLVATLYFGEASHAVRVRNLSATGALVEGAGFPAPGTSITLRRGALEAIGTLAWSQAGKAGLTFDGTIDVDSWMPTKASKPQSRVDSVTFQMKHGASPAILTVVPTPASGLSLDAVIAELAAVRAQMDALGNQLAGDEAVLARHPEVQTLDAASQRMMRVITALQAQTG